MGKNSLRHREQGARVVRLQGGEASSPFTCARDIDQPRRGDGGSRHHQGTCFQKLAPFHLPFSTLRFVQTASTGSFDHLANLRTRSTSAATTSGCPSRSGFAAIEALSPTELPPFTMIIAICWSLIDFCHFPLRKFCGFGFRFAAPGPAPPPSSPWHTAQRSANIEFAASRASGDIAFGLAPVEPAHPVD